MQTTGHFTGRQITVGVCNIEAILKKDNIVFLFISSLHCSCTTSYFFNHCCNQNTRYVNCKYIEDYLIVNVLKNSNFLIQILNILNISCILYMPHIICIDWYVPPTNRAYSKIHPKLSKKILKQYTIRCFLWIFYTKCTLLPCFLLLAICIYLSSSIRLLCMHLSVSTSLNFG